MAGIKQLFTGSLNIQVDRKADDVARLKQSVTQIVKLIEASRPSGTQGVFIDTAYGDGVVFQAFIDRLGPRFHYYGFENRSRFISNKFIIERENAGLPQFQLRVTGIINLGEGNFTSWLASLHASYRQAGVTPFIVMNSNLKGADYVALDWMARRGHMPKLGMLVAAFRGATTISKELHPNVESALQAHNIPVVEQFSPACKI